jgi:hypothetical protein
MKLVGEKRMGGSVRRVDALCEHQLEPFFQGLVAGTLEGGQRGSLVEILLALERAATADLARFAGQGPAADQVSFQLQLHEARGFASIRALLQEEAHGWIVSGDAAVRAVGPGG